ncbi:hypothetical protein [Neisseria sicca]|uniref:hypothetical protein n=1 Tax=Neisseria sicca TaxID=490 RepID=UPI0011BD0C21|nr:hypothetical protein [Neisseria sicca]
MKRKVFSDDLLLYPFVFTQHPLPVKTDVIGHIKLYPLSQKNFRRPLHIKRSSETGKAVGLNLPFCSFCVQKNKFSSSLHFAFYLIG